MPRPTPQRRVSSTSPHGLAIHECGAGTSSNLPNPHQINRFPFFGRVVSSELAIMMLLLPLLSLLGAFTSLVSATALTFKLGPNGKECFFANVEQKQAKVAFYFAVCHI